jgi:hypothetical protein
MNFFVIKVFFLIPNDIVYTLGYGIQLAEIRRDKGYWLWKICNVIGTWFTAIRIKKSKHNFISP